MKSKKLLIWLVLFTMISGCSFTQEERKVAHISSDGKLVFPTVEGEEPEEKEDTDEPEELEIVNPMPLREMPLPEKSFPEMELREMQLREMTVPEMQLREMPLRDN
jgi:hypothetical protein